MFKKIISVLTLVLILCMSMNVCFAAEQAKDNVEDNALVIKEVKFEVEPEKTSDGKETGVSKGLLTLDVANEGDLEVTNSVIAFSVEENIFSNISADEAMYFAQMNLENIVSLGKIPAGEAKTMIIPVEINSAKKGNPVVDCAICYVQNDMVLDFSVPKSADKEDVKEESEEKISPLDEFIKLNSSEGVKSVKFEDILNEKTEVISKKDAVINFLKQTGFSMTTWQSVLMILIACILFYLAIVKKFEPLLLLPISFGMLLTNLMGAEVFHESLFAGGHVHWGEFGIAGLIDYLYLGVKLGIYPCLIFVGVGAMTDFGPLIANPKSLLLGAAAQVGIFATFLGAIALGFSPAEAGSIGIIGGADGPTAIFVTSKLAPDLLGPIAVAAYSYMALVPVIQPPIMKLLTTKKERSIAMPALRQVSQKEKIVFPIVVTIFVALLVPSAAALVGCLMLGNLLKESGVCERLSKTVQNELMNIVTVFLGVSVGATATATTFLKLETIKIIVMGVVAFGVATACGVILAKVMNLFLKKKINPLIGSAGVSAVPMAARVSQKVGQEANPSNFLLMHAMGPNVAGVIGSAIAAGALIAMLG